MSQALEWVMSGRVFDAEEVLAGGLVRAAAARRIAAGSACTCQRIRGEYVVDLRGALPSDAVADGRGGPPDGSAQDRLARHRTLGKLPDCEEGVVSFLEKRPPNFPMKVSKDMPDYYPWWDEENSNKE